MVDENFNSYILNPDAFGTLLWKGCFKVLGSDFNTWESDTLIIEFNRMYGEVPDINIDKILSLVALSGSFDGRLCFFNDMNCFRHTVAVLNNASSDYDFMGPLAPELMHWAIHEIKGIYPEYELDEEPAKFMSLCYYQHGVMLLPKELSAYQEILNSYNENNKILPRIEKHIKELDVEDLTKVKFDELDIHDVLDVQFIHHVADRTYMGSRLFHYNQDREKLGLNE